MPPTGKFSVMHAGPVLKKFGWRDIFFGLRFVVCCECRVLDRYGKSCLDYQKKMGLVDLSGLETRRANSGENKLHKRQN